MSELFQASILRDKNGVEVQLMDETARAGLLNKVDTHQGVENAKSLLYVGDDGSVTGAELGPGFRTVTVPGKNLFHGQWEPGRWHFTTGIFEQDAVFMGNFTVNEMFPVEPSTPYTFSNTQANTSGAQLYVNEYTADKEFITHHSAVMPLQPVGSATITTSASTRYLTVYCYAYDEGNTTIEAAAPIGFMLEKGASATDYEAYKVLKTTIAVDDSGLPPVTTDDNGKALVVANGAWTAGKLQKNAVEGLVTDLIMYGESLDNKAPKDHTHSYADITDKPSAFTPSAHSHEQSEVNGLTNALAGKASVSHSHAYSEITGKPEAFPPEAHKHAKGDVEGLVTDLIDIYSALNDKDTAIAEKAPKDHTHAWSAITNKPDTFPPATHTHDYPVKSVNGMTGDVVIATGGGTDERLPQVTEADNGMPLRVENGEYKVGKLQKNAVEGLITDLITYGDALSSLEQNALTEDDRQSIINDALTALAGADPNNATAAVVENLTGRTSTLEVKFRNMAEDLSTLQRDVDEVGIGFVEYTIKMLYRLIRLERHLGLQPPVTQDGTSMETDADAGYDDVPWAE